MIARPRFLLFVEASLDADGVEGSWNFSLEALESEFELEASDRERGFGIQRLELIGLVRGLEALEQPSRVTLVSASRYLNRGLRNGLPLWRENEWQWERFGEMTPIKDADLWKRVDHALDFHDVQSRMLRIDGAHLRANRPHSSFEASFPSESYPLPQDSERVHSAPSDDDSPCDQAEMLPATLRMATTSIATSLAPSRPLPRSTSLEREARSSGSLAPLVIDEPDWEEENTDPEVAAARGGPGWWQHQADRAVRSAWLLTRRRRAR